MNAKERFYSGLARETIGKITSNKDSWTSFLVTVSRNYEFTYPEQVMIYAQRPNATFCKPYDEWNDEKYRRYVRRGSTGIALFVTNRDKPYLRYVFDVADTGAFDPDKGNWAQEYTTLKNLLSDDEYAAARASTLNAHYTSPTVIRSIYDAVGQMGFETGNILEPAMGIGNFFGMLPPEMQSSRLYGVELDSITGRIAQKLYPNAEIKVAGFETTDRRDFYDLAVGNVPFGNYKVSDKPYDKLGFSIHNYFFAKALDQVRPGGVVALAQGLN